MRILNFFTPSMRGDLLLMKNILLSLARKVLMPLELTEIASATDLALKIIFFDREWLL